MMQQLYSWVFESTDYVYFSNRNVVFQQQLYNLGWFLGNFSFKKEKKVSSKVTYKKVVLCVLVCDFQPEIVNLGGLSE